jgi:ABC-2 type transport system ATP-binding protein
VKSFGSHTAVDHLDLEIPRGSIYGLLGPNGSGKTTSIRMIMGILIPDSGRAELLGGRPDQATRQRVGYLPEERGLYRRMRVLDLLAFMGEIRGLTPAEGRRRGSAWLERLDLAGWADRRVEDLSKGMQQKVQFVSTVIHEPELLILDEPFSGLDPINQDVLEGIVREYHARGTTILFSTHLMDQAERLCDRVCLISSARKVLDGELRVLKAAESEGAVAVEFEGPDNWLDHSSVSHRKQVRGGWHLLMKSGEDPQDVLAAGLSAGARIRRFELVEPSLHDLFIRHAGGAPAPGRGPGSGRESARGGGA